MTRTRTKEIYIEIETIRLTRKHSVRKTTAKPGQTNASSAEDSFVETAWAFKTAFRPNSIKNFRNK